MGGGVADGQPDGSQNWTWLNIITSTVRWSKKVSSTWQRQERMCRGCERSSSISLQTSSWHSLLIKKNKCIQILVLCRDFEHYNMTMTTGDSRYLTSKRSCLIYLENICRLSSWSTSLRLQHYFTTFFLLAASTTDDKTKVREKHCAFWVFITSNITQRETQ